MKVSPLILQSVASRLQAAIGVDPAALNPRRLQWILRSRCRDLQMTEASTYADHLASNASELEALIDEVVVRETRFFRDPIVFDHIQRSIAQLASTASRPLRILSAPCSTGEEAYSLSAIIQRLGLAPDDYCIDALDISATALEAARHGIYAEKAMQHVPADLQTVTAERISRQWQVYPSVQRPVHFIRCNLAEAGALGTTPRYHLILCRNLFIYLAPSARATLAGSLHAALLPGGKLFLGTADHVEEVGKLFRPLRPAASFAYAHRQPAEAASLPTTSPKPGPRRSRPRPETTKTAALHPPLPSAPDNDTTPAPAAHELLARAIELHQRGELVRAEQRCRQALYLALNLIPALELLQLLWSSHPNLRQRRALGARLSRHQLASLLTPTAETTAPQEAK